MELPLFLKVIFVLIIVAVLFMADCLIIRQFEEERDIKIKS